MQFRTKSAIPTNNVENNASWLFPMQFKSPAICCSVSFCSSVNLFANSLNCIYDLLLPKSDAILAAVKRLGTALRHYVGCYWTRPIDPSATVQEHRLGHPVKCLQDSFQEDLSLVRLHASWAVNYRNSAKVKALRPIKSVQPTRMKTETAAHIVFFVLLVFKEAHD